MKIFSLLPFLCGLLIIFIGVLELKSYHSGEQKKNSFNSSKIGKIETTTTTSGNPIHFSSEIVTAIFVSITVFAALIVLLVVYEACKEMCVATTNEEVPTKLELEVTMEQQHQIEEDEKQKLVMLMLAHDPFSCFMI